MAVVLVSMKKRGKNKWSVAGLWCSRLGGPPMACSFGKLKPIRGVCWGHMPTEGEVVLGRVTKRAKTHTGVQK